MAHTLMGFLIFLSQNIIRKCSLDGSILKNVSFIEEMVLFDNHNKNVENLLLSFAILNFEETI